MNLTTLTNFDYWLIIKAMVLVALLLYDVFAVVLVRQVGLMLRTLNIQFEPLVRFLAWLHLCLAIGLFFLALVIL